MIRLRTFSVIDFLSNDAMSSFVSCLKAMRQFDNGRFFWEGTADAN